MTSFRINHHRVVLDCDGVLLDFDRGFSTVGQEVLGRPVAKVCGAYELDVRYGLSQAERNRVWDALDDHPLGWAGMHPLPGAAEAARFLKAMGLEIHLVTGIEQRHSANRIANLLSHQIDVDGIDCVGHGRASKAHHLMRLAPFMYVEDRLALLKESEFVPERVWVDHKDDQHGHVVDETIIHVSSLAQWVSQWSLRHGRPFAFDRKPAP